MFFCCHSYRNQQASPPYEGYACFSPPTLRTCPGIAPPAANGKLVSRSPPFVSRPASFLPLRRVRFIPAPHPSYRNQEAPFPYEGYACFSPPTLRTCPRDGPTTTNAKLVSRSPPFVSQPGSFSIPRQKRHWLKKQPVPHPRYDN